MKAFIFNVFLAHVKIYNSFYLITFLGCQNLPQFDEKSFLHPVVTDDDFGESSAANDSDRVSQPLKDRVLAAERIAVIPETGLEDIIMILL